jgi:hypothetical protein
MNTKVDSHGTEVKTVGRSGQISLGKRYAGKTLRLERFKDGRIVVPRQNLERVLNEQHADGLVTLLQDEIYWPCRVLANDRIAFLRQTVDAFRVARGSGSIARNLQVATTFVRGGRGRIAGTRVTYYSYLRVIIGSTRMARRAGA